MKRFPTLAACAAAACVLLATPAFAQAPAPDGGALAAVHDVLSLTASASAQVQKDLLSVSLAATREGDDAQRVQSQLKQALEAALETARKQARTGQLDVRTGDFSVYPRYNDKGRITGWQGSASMVIEGRDIPAIAQLAARLPSMAITNVNYALAPETRKRVEAEVTGQAIARYRERAQAMSKLFGYGGYAIREVSVSGDEPSGPIHPVFAMARAKGAMGDETPLPTEPGMETVSVTVNGSVQMR
jgi:predicted secreted protein